MDDILLLSWLKNKGINEEDFHKALEKYFKEGHIKSDATVNRDSRMWDIPDYVGDKNFENKDFNIDEFYVRRDSHLSDSNMLKKFKSMSHEDKKVLMEMMMEETPKDRFNETHAKYVVASMFHHECGRKYVGEKFDIMKAKEVCERYKSILSNTVSHYEVYVAINSHYHDYCELYKNWFGENADTKIIESAIVFWFKDHDYKGSCKIWEYYNKD